jgi:hypothetical protein
MATAIEFYPPQTRLNDLKEAVEMATADGKVTNREMTALEKEVIEGDWITKITAQTKRGRERFTHAQIAHISMPHQSLLAGEYFLFQDGEKLVFKKSWLDRDAIPPEPTFKFLDVNAFVTDTIIRKIEQIKP